MPLAVRIVPVLVAVAVACAACARGDVRRETADELAQASPDDRVTIPRAIGGGPRSTRDLVPVVEVPRAEAGAYVGAHVELGGVVVQSLASDRAFWVGPDPERQILVVLDAPPPIGPGRQAHAPELAPRAVGTVAHVGDTIDVEGTLRELPSPEGALRAFHLSPIQLPRVLSQDLYIDATRITPFAD